MKKVFVILYEPASYTVDRNKAVYDKMGINYCYMFNSSLAKSEHDEHIDVLPGNFCGRFVRLRNILKENDIVIINGCTDSISLMLFCLNLFYRRPIGIDLDCQLVLPKNKIKEIMKKFVMHLFYCNKLHYGLAGGSVKHMEYFEYYGMKKERIFLSPMVVNNKKFEYDGVRASDVFKFLYVGRIIEVKNIQLMIDAFLTAFGNSPHVEMRIVGKGILLEKYKKDYSIYSNVIFEGPKYGKDLVDEYKQANVFVLPSSYEPWGLVVNEAMSSGLPCIVSDQVGAAWDLVDGKHTGFIFHYDNLDELASRMKEIAENNATYNRYSKNAYELVHDYWNYDLYKKCLNKFINTVG